MVDHIKSEIKFLNIFLFFFKKIAFEVSICMLPNEELMFSKYELRRAAVRLH